MVLFRNVDVFASVGFEKRGSILLLMSKLEALIRYVNKQRLAAC
jgi:hypothetical protein